MLDVVLDGTSICIVELTVQKYNILEQVAFNQVNPDKYHRLGKSPEENVQEKKAMSVFGTLTCKRHSLDNTLSEETQTSCDTGCKELGSCHEA